MILKEENNLIRNSIFTNENRITKTILKTVITKCFVNNIGKIKNRETVISENSIFER